MRKIRITVSDGPCTSSMTKHVTDIPTCIEQTFISENTFGKHTSRGVQEIILTFKDGEVLGGPGDEEAWGNV